MASPMLVSMWASLPNPSVATTDHFITVLQVNSQVFYSWDILTPNLSCVLIHTVYKPCSVCSLQKLLTGSCVTTLNHAYYKYRSAFPDPNKCRFVLHMITLLWRTLLRCCQAFLCISLQRSNKSCSSSFSRSFVVHPSFTCLMCSFSHRTNSQSCHRPSAHDTTTLGHSHISPYRLCDALQWEELFAHTCKTNTPAKFSLFSVPTKTWQGSGSCAEQTPSCWFIVLPIWLHTSSRTVSGARLFYRWSCMKPGFGLDDPCGYHSILLKIPRYFHASMVRSSSRTHVTN